MKEQKKKTKENKNQTVRPCIIVYTYTIMIMPVSFTDICSIGLFPVLPTLHLGNETCRGNQKNRQKQTKYSHMSHSRPHPFYLRQYFKFVRQFKT